MPHPVIAMDSVESSQIASIGHDGISTMAIQFKHLCDSQINEYRYANVTPEQFKAFKESESIGKHFKEHFKTKIIEHPFTKIIKPQPSEN